MTTVLSKSHAGESVELVLSENSRRAHVFFDDAREWQDRIERVGYGAVSITADGANNSQGHTLRLGACYVVSAAYVPAQALYDMPDATRDVWILAASVSELSAVEKRLVETANDTRGAKKLARVRAALDAVRAQLFFRTGV